MTMTLDALRDALETLRAGGYPGDAELVLVSVMHDPAAPQMAIEMAIAVREDDELAFVPGTTLPVAED